LKIFTGNRIIGKSEPDTHSCIKVANVLVTRTTYPNHATIQFVPAFDDWMLSPSRIDAKQGDLFVPLHKDFFDLGRMTGGKL
jgi:hypothetical protein